MTKKSYLKDNKDIIKGFTKAIQKSIDYTFKSTNEELSKIIAVYFSDTCKNDLTETIKRYRVTDSWDKTTCITEEGFKRVQDIMKNSNKLDEKVPYEKLVNNEYNKI